MSHPLGSAALWILFLPAVPAAAAQADENSFHAQTTTVSQFQPSFRSPYAGTHSLSPGYESRTSLTSTVFFGHRLWDGAGLYINPELTALSGLSGTQGVASFPNGEIYRVSDPNPQVNVSRVYVQQVFGFGGELEAIPDDANQLAEQDRQRRITLIGGKFSLNDFFDNNAYSHDPRTQFLNWALMDNGAWDYAADTRGYTFGLYIELKWDEWSFRFASVAEPKVANQINLDTRLLDTRADNAEFEYRYALGSHPGKSRLLAYRNRAHMGLYRQAINDNPSAPDITEAESQNRVKFGFGLNIEQELTSDLGVFGRAGWNNGSTESWAFTEIDRALTAGISLKGSSWSRPNDILGGAVIWSGLSKDHADYLSSGGVDFSIGDGRLNYAPEQVFETYYSWQLRKEVTVSGDFQFFENPGFNHDRGPVNIFSVRLHYEL